MEILVLIVLIAAVVVGQMALYGRRVFRHLEYGCRLDREEAREGDEIEILETVSNRKWLPVPWLKSEITTSRWLDFAGAQSVVTDKTRFVPSFFMVRSYQRVQRAWKVKCLKRGVFSLQSVVLVASDLLGMSSFSQPVELDSEITVLPGELDAAAEFSAPRHLFGEFSVRRNLLADPFFIAGVREYAQGDPMNRIHWAATARERRLMVYQNEYTAQQSAAVILNIQSREFESREVIDAPAVEDAIRVCAWLFREIAGTGVPLRFLANGPVEPGGREPVVSEEYFGEEHIHDLLVVLARLQLRSTQAFPEFLAEWYDGVAASNIFLVTAYLNEEILNFARDKAPAGVRVRVFVTNVLDQAPEDVEVYCLKDGGREPS
ncbi:MAG: DUF58 domain-containing protein [Oscillospiraceae bacterium]|nr:DUF58 domain-containing protein [Oscillospiraceae bacterium]